MFDSVRDWIYSIESTPLRLRCIEDLAELAADLRHEERKAGNLPMPGQRRLFAVGGDR